MNDNTNDRDLRKVFDNLKKVRKEQEKNREESHNTSKMNVQNGNASSINYGNIAENIAENANRNANRKASRNVNEKASRKIKKDQNVHYSSKNAHGYSKRAKNANYKGKLAYKFDMLRADRKKFRSFLIMTSFYFIVIAIIAVILINYVIEKNKTVNPYGAIATYEKNASPINLSQILVNNMNTTKSKEKAYIDKEIPYGTKFIQNEALPKDEKKVVTPGIQGKERVNIMRTYEGFDLVNETISNIDIIQAPVEEVVEVGTSDFLVNFNVHIGDTMYVLNTIDLLDAPKASGSVITRITRYMDVTLLEVLGDWCKVSFNGKEGYLPSTSLTSKSVTPTIVTQNQIEKVVSKLDFNMLLNVKSGLSLDDYKKMLSNNPKDVNKIIEQNADAFYNAEQKYGINGVLLAAMAVHESGWATSAISKDKKNLFGYGAYDRDAYNSAYTFDTYAEGVDLVAKVLTKAYLNPAGVAMPDGDVTTGKYYTSATLTGINTRYSTDPNWSTKVFSYMTYFYDKL